MADCERGGCCGGSFYDLLGYGTQASSGVIYLWGLGTVEGVLRVLSGCCKALLLRYQGPGGRILTCRGVWVAEWDLETSGLVQDRQHSGDL